MWIEELVMMSSPLGIFGYYLYAEYNYCVEYDSNGSCLLSRYMLISLLSLRPVSH